MLVGHPFLGVSAEGVGLTFIVGLFLFKVGDLSYFCGGLDNWIVKKYRINF